MTRRLVSLPANEAGPEATVDLLRADRWEVNGETLYQSADGRFLLLAPPDGLTWVTTAEAMAWFLRHRAAIEHRPPDYPAVADELEEVKVALPTGVLDALERLADKRKTSIDHELQRAADRWLRESEKR